VLMSSPACERPGSILAQPCAGQLRQAHCRVRSEFLHEPSSTKRKSPFFENAVFESRQGLRRSGQCCSVYAIVWPTTSAV